MGKKAPASSPNPSPERQAGEKELPQSGLASEFQGLLDAMPDAIVIADKRGRIHTVNSQAEKLFGYWSEELSGQTLALLIPERFRKKHDSHQMDYFRNAKTRPMGPGQELYGLRKDGSEFPADVSLRPLKTADGNLVIAAIRDVSGRKQLEEALRQQKNLHETMMQAQSDLGDGWLIIEGEHIIFANEAFCRMSGRSAKSLAALSSFYKLVPTGEHAHLQDCLRRRSSGGHVPHHFETRMFRKDRREIQVEAVVKLLEVTGQMAVIVRDINDHKQAEEDLLQSEANLAAAQRITHLGSWELDLTNLADINSNPLRWSDEVFRIFGYEPGGIKVSNDNFFRGVHPDDRDRIVSAVAAAVKTGQPYQLDHRILRPNGSERIVHEQSEIVFDVDGRPFKMVGTIHDITERERSKQALQASEQHFRAVVERSTDEILILDASLKPIYMSPSVLRASGFSAEESMGFEGFGFVHPDDLAGVQQIFVEFVKRPGESQYFQIRVRRKDGSWRWIDGTATNLLNDPVIRGILINYRDITERKQHHLELEAVARISAALRSAQSLDEMLPRLIEESMAALGATAASIWLYHPAGDDLRAAYERGWTIKTPLLKRGQGIPGHVLASGQPYIAREFKSDPMTDELARQVIPPGQGGACVPIRAADQVIGALLVGAQLPREFTAADVSLLTTLAEIAGNAIQRTRLHEQTRQSLKNIAALHAIDTAISSSFDLPFILNVMLDQVTSQLEVDAADILLLEPDLKVLEYGAGRGFHTQTNERLMLRLGEGHAGKAALEQRTVSIHKLSAATQDLVRAQMILLEGFVSYYGVPLISKGQVRGVLEIFHRKPLDPDPEWLNFMDALAGQAAIAIADARLFSELQRSNVELTLAYDSTIEGWSHALDLRDRETEGHTQRVTEATMQLARIMGFVDSELVHIRRGALLHDIGKMGIPDSILLKPDKLTGQEWEIMRKHPRYAYEMLSPIQFLRPALDIPYCHHEKWDGSGYPRGLSGEEIPLVARLFAIVDICDALRSDRPYRPAWPEEKIQAYVLSLSGNHLDPHVVEAYVRANGKIGTTPQN